MSITNEQTAEALAKLRAVMRGRTDDDLVRVMANRFLGWRLPKDFAPDAGISFNPTKPNCYDEQGWWPVGTNLFTAEQTEQMVRHMLGVKK